MDPATPLVATGAAALGLYMYYKGRNATNSALTDGGLSPPIPVEAWRHDDVSHPPSTWGEALLYLKEAFRWGCFRSMTSSHCMPSVEPYRYLSGRNIHQSKAIPLQIRIHGIVGARAYCGSLHWTSLPVSPGGTRVPGAGHCPEGPPDQL